MKKIFKKKLKSTRTKRMRKDKVLEKIWCPHFGSWEVETYSATVLVAEWKTEPNYL